MLIVTYDSETRRHGVEKAVRNVSNRSGMTV